MDGQIDGWMDRWMNGQIGGWTDRLVHEWIDWWMDRQIDGWMDRQVDGWMNNENNYNTMYKDLIWQIVFCQYKTYWTYCYHVILQLYNDKNRPTHSQLYILNNTLPVI